MSVRTFSEILAAAGKQVVGADSTVIAAAIIAEALDRHTEATAAIAAALKQIAERPK